MFKKEPTEDALKEKVQLLAIEDEVLGKEKDILEKKAIINQLKKNYGSGWRDILGLKGKLDLQTLLSVVDRLGRGMREAQRKRTYY